jgi:hypothetical protein
MSVADVSATGFYFWFFRCVFFNRSAAVAARHEGGLTNR